MRTKSIAWMGVVWLVAAGGAWAADADHDGVEDGVDKCPGTAQVRKVNPDFRYALTVSPERRSAEPRSVAVDAEGCALDTDGDGVADHQDFCPEDTAEMISKGVTTQGCPISSDGDGTPDYRDDCPGTPRGVPADRRGCPVEG